MALFMVGDVLETCVFILFEDCSECSRSLIFEICLLGLYMKMAKFT